MLRLEAIEALQSSSLIIHAGDIGKPEVLDTLKRIAPVTAVRGNFDKGSWVQSLPLTEAIEIGAIFLNPGSAGPGRFQLPVSVAIIEVQDKVLKPQLVELTIKS